MNARLREALRNGVADPWACSVLWGGKGGSPPAAPDPYATAAAQGAANKETAIAQGRINNPNITNPLGQQTVTWGAPDDTGVSQPSINQTLSPAGQQQFDQQQRISGQLGGLAEQGIDRVGQSIGQPFDISGAPQAVNSIGQQSYTGSVGNGGEIQRDLDYSGVSRAPTMDDFSGDRDRIEQALYSRLEPQMQRDEAAMRQRLSNQGLTQTHEAYGADVDAMNRQKTDARMQTILAGAGEQGRLFNQAMQARQQGVGEVNNQGAFTNNAQNQLFSQGLASGNFANQAAQLRSGEALTNANLANQGRQQSIQEQSFLRQLPLNEINALRSGSQVSMPQFQGFNGANLAPPPVAQSIQNAYGQNLNAYNAQQAQQGSFNSGLMSLAGTGAMLAFSDRRLKSDIRRIGTHRRGIGIYSYTIFGRPSVGVMADEVEKVLPEAVITTSSGYKAVNYAML